MNEKTLKSYFETALILADMGKVKRLFATLGYRDYQKITAEMCITALNAHGFKFSIPFGTLAKIALKTPKVESFIRARKIERITGVNVPPAAPAPPVVSISGIGTTSNKNGSGLAVFSEISNFLIGGVKSGADLLNAIKGRDLILAEAALEQQRANTAANTKKTNWLAILGVAGAVILIVVVVVVLKGKK